MLCMILGNIILAAGVAIFKLSSLGNDPYSGMVMGIAEDIHMQYANFLLILNAVLFVVELLFGRKYIGPGTFFNGLLQGYIVTFFYQIMVRITVPELLWQRLVTVFIGLIIAGIGLSLYQNANAGASPYDSLSMILSDYTHKSYYGCRISTDLICAVICFFAGGIVNVGMVACVLLIGPVADFFNQKFVSRLMEKTTS